MKRRVVSLDPECKNSKTEFKAKKKMSKKFKRLNN